MYSETFNFLGFLALKGVETVETSKALRTKVIKPVANERLPGLRNEPPGWAKRETRKATNGQSGSKPSQNDVF